MNIDEMLSKVSVESFETCISLYETNPKFEGIFVHLRNRITGAISAYAYHINDDPLKPKTYNVKPIHYDGTYFIVLENDIKNTEMIEVSYEKFYECYKLALVMDKV